MKTFQIITDSSCDLPQELADKLVNILRLLILMEQIKLLQQVEMEL